MATYTEAQLEQYFNHINYPRRDHHIHATNSIEFLTELQKHNLARIPFESVSLHYSKHRLLSLDPEDLFQKIVGNSRGGYCMEANAFFATVLRSLGFTLISAGGRVKSEHGFKGWNHMVNIVTIDQKRYLVDVSVGPVGPVSPVLLESGIEFDGVSPLKGRLEYRAIAEHTDPKQRLWVFSHREELDSLWKEFYAFADIEFFPADFEVMNLSTMTTPQSFFVQTVLATRLLLNKETKEVRGVQILHNDEVKRREGGKTEVIERLKTEEDRVRALREYFFIDLRPEEQRAIRGLVSELKGH